MENGRQMRFTDEEIELLKHTFGKNEKLVKLLRKLFLPWIDPEAPLGQIIDLWMTVPIKEMSERDALLNIHARNSLITHVESVLIQMNGLANMDNKTIEDLKKNSAK